jgi:hypothetical protein
MYRFLRMQKNAPPLMETWGDAKLWQNVCRKNSLMTIRLFFSTSAPLEGEHYTTAVLYQVQT